MQVFKLRDRNYNRDYYLIIKIIISLYIFLQTTDYIHTLLSLQLEGIMLGQE